MSARTLRMVSCMALAVVLAMSGQAQAGPSGAIAEYAFNGNANDGSGNGLHGTAVGGADFSTPGVVCLDGVNGYIIVGDSSMLSGMGSLTVTGKFQAHYWPDWTVDKGSAAIAVKAEIGDGWDQTDCFQVALIRLSGVPTVEGTLWSGANTCTLTGAPGSFIPGFDPYGVNDVALAYTGSAARLYANGVEIGAKPFAGRLNSNPGVPLQMGHTYGASMHNLYFDGALDHVRIASTDLALYPMNGNANDVSGHMHNGTPHNVDFSTASLARFNGHDSSIDVVDNATLSGMTQLTAGCRFKAEYWPEWETDRGDAGLVGIVNNGDGDPATDSWHLSLMRHGGKYCIEAAVWTTAGECSLEAPLDNLLAGFDPYGWHDASLAYDGNMARVWVDGVEVAAKDFSGTLNSPVGVPLRIGHTYGASEHNLYFDGWIDDVWVTPEPATLALMGLGGLGMLLRRRRR